MNKTKTSNHLPNNEIKTMATQIMPNSRMITEEENKILEDIAELRDSCKRLRRLEEHVNQQLQRYEQQIKQGLGSHEDVLSLRFIREEILELKESLGFAREVNLSGGNSLIRDNALVSKTDNASIISVDWLLQCSAFKEIESVYEGLDDGEVRLRKKWLSCLSVFPDNSVMKRRVITNWWAGEEASCFPDYEIWNEASRFFDLLLTKGIIEPLLTNRRPVVKKCKMQPFTRQMLIALAKKEEFIEVDDSGEIKYDVVSPSRKAFLYKSKKGSSQHNLRNSENIDTLFNINESFIDIQDQWFSEVRDLRVLQLGRWQASKNHHIEAASKEFLRELKGMKGLIYMSLQGISMISEIPVSLENNELLQILDLKACHDLRKTPRGLGKLKYLMVLDMSDCYHISHMPKEMACLSELRVLKGFLVSYPAEREPCRLAELANLRYLEKLSIYADVSKGEATETELLHLKKFKALRSLTIEWVGVTVGNNTNASSSAHKKANDSVPVPKKTSRKKSAIHIPRIRRSKSAPPAVAEDIRTVPSSLKLEKLDLLATPWKRIPAWLYPENNSNFTKLYIRGGKLRDIRCENPMQTVKILRLKHLLQLDIEWAQLNAEFPLLDYVELVNCPKLQFFPCDSTGVWVRPQKSSSS